MERDRLPILAVMKAIRYIRIIYWSKEYRNIQDREDERKEQDIKLNIIYPLPPRGFSPNALFFFHLPYKQKTFMDPYAMRLRARYIMQC